MMRRLVEIVVLMWFAAGQVWAAGADGLGFDCPYDYYSFGSGRKAERGDWYKPAQPLLLTPGLVEVIAAVRNPAENGVLVLDGDWWLKRINIQTGQVQPVGSIAPMGETPLDISVTPGGDTYLLTNRAVRRIVGLSPAIVLTAREIGHEPRKLAVRELQGGNLMVWVLSTHALETFEVTPTGTARRVGSRGLTYEGLAIGLKTAWPRSGAAVATTGGLIFFEDPTLNSQFVTPLVFTSVTDSCTGYCLEHPTDPLCRDVCAYFVMFGTEADGTVHRIELRDGTATVVGHLQAGAKLVQTRHLIWSGRP